MKTLNLKYFVVKSLIFRGHVTSSVTWPLDSAYAVSYWWSIVTMHLSCIVTEIWGPKDIGITTLTFWGHVTSSVTWPLDSAYVVSYWWSIGTMRLSCIKVAFAHVKGQKFSAHAPCHVTCRQGVQNDHIFGIPEAILPIHYTTFMGLRWRLGVVYRGNFYTAAFLAENPPTGLICRSVNEKKGIYTIEKFSLYFTHLPRSPQWTDLHEILHGGSTRRRNHLFQILCRSVERFRICAGSNFAILPLLSRSPLTQG